MHQLSFVCDCVKMSVDVFGRQLLNNKRVRSYAGPRGPPGEGYKIIGDGQFDISNKRLCNIADAVNINDAASVKVVRAMMKSEIQAVDQTITSLKDSTDNNYSMINALNAIIENIKLMNEEKSTKAEELSMRNAEIIQQLDSRIRKLEGLFHK